MLDKVGMGKAFARGQEDSSTMPTVGDQAEYEGHWDVEEGGGNRGIENANKYIRENGSQVSQCWRRK